MYNDKKMTRQQSDEHDAVIRKMIDLYHMLVCHNGFGEMRVETRILKRNQKEVIIHCGKQYRFVVGPNCADWLSSWKHDEDDMSCQNHEPPTSGNGANLREMIRPQ
ncbi:MAG: hypothetical protein V5783_03025 [Pontiella sp.]